MLYGSQVGGRLKARFPGLSLKARGGVERFIYDLVGDAITATKSANGGDVTFVRSGSEAQVKNSPILTGQDEVWRVFHNPKLTEWRLFWDTEEQTLKAVIVDYPVSSAWKEVRRVTTEVQNQLTKEFAQLRINELSGDSDAQAVWSRAIETDDIKLWPLFSLALKTQGSMSQWLKYRWQRLEELFVLALMEVGLDHDTAQKKAAVAMEMAAAARRTKAVKSHDSNVATPKPGRICPNLTMSVSDLDRKMTVARTLAYQLVKCMTEEELARIQVSLATVLACFNTNKEG